jgi:hypothetical protein
MSAWPYTDEPGAGLVAGCEIEDACWRKRKVVLTRDQVEGMDDVASYSQPTAPAEACTDLGFEDGEPVTGWEAVKVWAGLYSPALVSGAVFVLVVWGFKP